MPLPEMATKFLDALPAFARGLVTLLLNPKSAVLSQDLESDEALQKALTFLAVTFGIAFVGQIPFLPAKGDKEIIFGLLALQSGLSLALNAAIVVIAWKIVGGSLARKQMVVATCYFCGVSTLLFLFVSLIADGTFLTIDPVGFHQVMSNTTPDFHAMVTSPGFIAFAVLMACAFLVTYVWIFVVWGAYRQLMQLTRLRSAFALAIFLVCTPLLFAVQALLGTALFRVGAGPAIPSELAGQWQKVDKVESSKVHSIDILTYSFAPPEHWWLSVGGYFRTEISGSAEGGCALETTQNEFGDVSVHGDTLTLIPQQRTQSTTNSCTGKSTQATMDLKAAEYKFKVNQQPTGWILCLNDRFGQTCLAAKKQ